MANKQLKYPVPSSSQVWKNAMTLMQYAARLDIDASAIAINNDVTAKIMLSEVHQEIEEFFKKRRIDAGRGVKASMVDSLAKVYEKVKAGELMDEVKYRYAIISCGFGSSNPDWPEDIEPLPEDILGVFLKDSKLISEEGGPLQSAAYSASEYFEKSDRQLIEYHTKKNNGQLAYCPFEAARYYYPSLDFFKSVLINIFRLTEENTENVINALKEVSDII